MIDDIELISLFKWQRPNIYKLLDHSKPRTINIKDNQSLIIKKITQDIVVVTLVTDKGGKTKLFRLIN